MTKLQKGGSNADEPANINISDYTSDEGDSDESSGDDDGPRKKQLTVPPCSPASPSPPMPRLREGGSAKLIRQLPIILSSPLQRKTIPIGRAVLEVEWSEGEDNISNSDGECDGDNKPTTSPAKFGISPLKHSNSPARYRKQDAVQPPQLIVTSAKQASERKRLTERSKSADYTRGIGEKEIEKPKIYRSPGRVVEVETRSTASLQTLILGASDFSITWAHFSKQQDRILRSCSKKLAQFVRRQKNKKEKKIKSEKDEDKTTLRKKVKIKATRSRKVDQSSGSDAKEGKTDPLKIKSIKSTDSNKSSSEKKKLTQAAKTFRKGGIVAAAAVNSKKLKGNEDTPEMPLLKKKKKKKKLAQLQTKVKSVFTVVTSTTAKK